MVQLNPYPASLLLDPKSSIRSVRLPISWFSASPLGIPRPFPGQFLNNWPTKKPQNSQKMAQNQKNKNPPPQTKDPRSKKPLPKHEVNQANHRLTSLKVQQFSQSTGSPTDSTKPPPRPHRYRDNRPESTGHRAHPRNPRYTATTHKNNKIKFPHPDHPPHAAHVIVVGHSDRW